MDNRTILQLYAKWQKLPVKHFQLPHSNAVREQQSAAEAPREKKKKKQKSGEKKNPNHPQGSRSYRHAEFTQTCWEVQSLIIMMLK